MANWIQCEAQELIDYYRCHAASADKAVIPFTPNSETKARLIAGILDDCGFDCTVMEGQQYGRLTMSRKERLG